MKIGQPFQTIIDYVCTYVHVSIHNTKESLALNLETGKINWHSTVIADIRDSALSLVVSQMADPTQFWSAVFMFCSEKGRWQAAISSSDSIYNTYYVAFYTVTVAVLRTLSCNISILNRS